MLKPYHGYWVSDMGIVYDSSYKAVPTKKDRYGEVVVYLYINNRFSKKYKVCDLVNELYVHLDGYVSHKDGNKLNNCYWNLCVGDPDEGKYVIIRENPYYESPVFDTLKEACEWLEGFDPENITTDNLYLILSHDKKYKQYKLLRR